VPWIGWYEAIADLIPSLPDSEFAKWQLDLLPEGFRGNPHRALLVDGLANNRGTSVTTVPGDRPAFTIKASAYKHAVRAFIPNGRVVYITPDCLARFQSVPNGYRLTGKPALDCRVIGNGFPCLLAKALVDAQGIS